MAKAKIGPKGKSSGRLVLSAVGGKKLPSVDNWIAGYRAGALAVDKRFKVPSTTRATSALHRSEVQGDRAQAHLPGRSGGLPGRRRLWPRRAAGRKQKGVWGIGVDADQGYLGKHIMTSGVKRVDTAVYTFYKLAQGRQARRRQTTCVFNLKNKGQDVGKISPRVPARSSPR